MPGVEVVREFAFCGCESLSDVVCGKLEIIKGEAFSDCQSLRRITLLSARIVEEGSFTECRFLPDVKFGNKLERLEAGIFDNCESLERITIPLKDGLFNDEDTFIGCQNLKHVDLVKGEVHATIALFTWRTGEII